MTSLQQTHFATIVDIDKGFARSNYPISADINGHTFVDKGCAAIAERILKGEHLLDAALHFTRSDHSKHGYNHNDQYTGFTNKDYYDTCKKRMKKEPEHPLIPIMRDIIIGDFDDMFNDYSGAEPYDVCKLYSRIYDQHTINARGFAEAAFQTGGNNDSGISACNSKATDILSTESRHMDAYFVASEMD